MPHPADQSSFVSPRERNVSDYRTPCARVKSLAVAFDGRMWYGATVVRGELADAVAEAIDHTPKRFRVAGEWVESLHEVDSPAAAS